MASGSTPSRGLFDDLRNLFGSLVELAGRRLELLTLEAQEEKARLLDLVFRAALIIVLSWMALVCATATLVVAFWDRHPVLVLVVVTLAYGGAAAWLALSLRRRLREASRPFAVTIEELRKDRECFGTKN
jgi:uncharacterized membrane protein YqjE